MIRPVFLAAARLMPIFNCPMRSGSMVRSASAGLTGWVDGALDGAADVGSAGSLLAETAGAAADEATPPALWVVLSPQAAARTTTAVTPKALAKRCIRCPFLS